jgi:hypothetical protein
MQAGSFAAVMVCLLAEYAAVRHPYTSREAALLC